MKYLLDSHTLIWFLENDLRLSEKSKNILEDENSELYVSIVSLWEINIKINLGKITLSVSLKEIVDRMESLSINILPLNFLHVLGIDQLSSHHRDPFDRMLISQSITEDLTIISKDENFKLYQAKVVW